MIKLPNINGLVKIGKNFMQANRPEILLGVSAVGTVVGGILAAKGGYEARGIVDQVERENAAAAIANKTDYEPLNVKEKIQLTWLCYMPAVLATSTALGATGGLHLVHVKEKKALAIAGMAAIEELKDEFKKNGLGVVSNEERQQILGQRAEDTPIGPDKSSHLQDSDHNLEEMYLVRDARTGRDIWSNKHRIEDALIEVNMVLNNSGDVELNHFYRHAGFNNIPDGHTYGWNMKDMVSIEWHDTHRDDGRPVREFTFRPEPTSGYDRHH